MKYPLKVVEWGVKILRAKMSLDESKHYNRQDEVGLILKAYNAIRDLNNEDSQLDDAILAFDEALKIYGNDVITANLQRLDG